MTDNEMHRIPGWTCERGRIGSAARAGAASRRRTSTLAAISLRAGKGREGTARGGSS
jgi:hypothetical protein